MRSVWKKKGFGWTKTIFRMQVIEELLLHTWNWEITWWTRDLRNSGGRKPFRWPLKWCIIMVSKYCCPRYPSAASWRNSKIPIQACIRNWKVVCSNNISKINYKVCITIYSVYLYDKETQKSNGESSKSNINLNFKWQHIGRNVICLISDHWPE